MGYKPFIIRDTREQKGNGWIFPPNELFSGTKTIKLDTGDYSIEGLEHVVTIERKGSVDELTTNLSEKRFTNELIRMKDIKISEIVLEFELSDILKYPLGSNATFKCEFLVVDHIKEKIQTGRNAGLTMSMLVCQDAHGHQKNILMFPDVYNKYGNRITLNTVITFIGRCSSVKEGYLTVVSGLLVSNSRSFTGISNHPRLTASAILAKMHKLVVTYPYIKFSFVGDNGERYVSSLLKRVVENEFKRRA